MTILVTMNEGEKLNKLNFVATECSVSGLFKIGAYFSGLPIGRNLTEHDFKTIKSWRVPNVPNLEFIKWTKMWTRWHPPIYKISARWRNSKFQFQRISIPTSRWRWSIRNIQSDHFLLGSSLSWRWQLKCMHPWLLRKLKPEVEPEVIIVIW